MYLSNGELRLSASDLMRFMSCRHATALDLAHLEGTGPDPVKDSEDAELLQKHGDAHEAAHLARLEAEGRDVCKIETDGRSFEEAARSTLAALEAGHGIVFQGALQGGIWGGYADFLECVAVPSALGQHSYEVSDTKLKRKPAPGHILQLCLYSDLLADVQGIFPEKAHVLLGTGERFSFRLAEYANYARLTRRALEAFVTERPETEPVPCSMCELCRWRVHCKETWRRQDSLFLVAGITKSQVAKLTVAGVETMQALAGHEERVPKLATETHDKLRTQARLQHARKTAEPHWELRPHVPGKGFDLMPRPTEGDLFYDIEGDPFYRENGLEGLEYLHGVWDGSEFAAIWAHDLVQERQALVDLFSLFETEIDRYPDAHIYHYANYEIRALRQLTTRHGYGEGLLDRWLRERRFVDLFAVVRGGVFASEPSYSIKDMEAFYELSREGEVVSAGGSIVAYERWRDSDDDAILSELEDYNRLDCVSTQKLRDWLLSIRPEGDWLELGEGVTERTEEKEAAIQDMEDRLAASDLSTDRKRMLFDLGVFHWREAKPAAWAVFDAAAKEFEDLVEDLDCLAGLVAIGAQRPVARSVERDYRYPPQETKLRVGKRARFVKEEGFGSVVITDLERQRHTLTVKMGPSSGNHLPDRLDLIPDFGLDASVIAAAVDTVIRDQCSDKANCAAEDILSRNAPRFTGEVPLPAPEDADPIDTMIAAARALDESVLPVQGPPGTGKTYATARTILALVGDGFRVAVSSNSHEAIRNVLMACVDALNEGVFGLSPGDIDLVHKIGQDTEDPPTGYQSIQSATSNQDDALFQAKIVGGTAWMFCRPEFEGEFDYLFIDEAGQVSLANLVGMAKTARNIILVGDPRQLPQVVQGAHPYPANLSCLDWVLGDGRNVEPERGVFLPVTRRMHSDLCRYISGQFYEGRVRSHGSTERQRIEADGVRPTGAWLVPMDHNGRAQESEEEVRAIAEMISRLLDGRWIDQNGNDRALIANDIIVVAPYNAQVNALSDALPDIRVGTVDKFQGQEAAVALVSMTTSSAEETSRGLDFLLSRERLNVAISRGRALSLVFASSELLQTNCSTVEQMRLVNALCALEQL